MEAYLSGIISGLVVFVTRRAPFYELVFALFNGKSSIACYAIL